MKRWFVQFRLGPESRWQPRGFASDPETAQGIADRQLTYLKSKDRIQPSPIEVRVIEGETDQ